MSPLLRVLAMTAPHWPERPKSSVVRSFSAATPFSLQNAVRFAAGQAEKGQGAWAQSNWVTLKDRRDSVRLFEFMDDARAELSLLLPKLRPNLVLIGSMSLGLPGAIEIAALIRAELSDDCLIVLGGRHVTETMYTQKHSSEVSILANCPLALMKHACPLTSGNFCLNIREAVVR